MPHRFVATHAAFVIIRARLSMRKIGLILLLAFAFCFAAPASRAQSDDPSETFLKAYMTSQQGEKLEHENQFKSALSKYRFAGTLLEQLRKAHPDWQPAIVEYRGRKVSEAILRVQDKAGTQADMTAQAAGADETAASAPPPPLQVAKEKTTAPAAPVQVGKEKPAASAPPVQIAKEKPAATPAPVVTKPAPSSTPNEVAIEQATRKLRDRVDQLEAELRNRGLR